jgi:hypothetical protein
MYKLAFEANPRLEETPSRIRNLANVSLPEKQMEAREELTSLRTVRLPDITKTDANADFDVLLAVSGKIEKAKFLYGSDVLRGAAKMLEMPSSKNHFRQPPRRAWLEKGFFPALLTRVAISCFIRYRWLREQTNSLEKAAPARDEISPESKH